MVVIGQSVVVKDLKTGEVQAYEVEDVIVDLHDTDYPVQLCFSNDRMFWFGVSTSKSSISACGSVEIILGED